jgi:hypothetical protein
MDAHFSKDAHGRFLVRTLMDAHFSKDAHGRFLVRMLMDAHGRLWTLMDAHGRSWTLMDAHGRSWMILRRFSDAGRTLGGRKPDACRTILDDQGRSENLVTRRSRDGHATVTRRSRDGHATVTGRSRDGHKTVTRRSRSRFRFIRNTVIKIQNFPL